jgi:hypothetical protein
MIFSSVGAHNQDNIGIANICPVIGHGTATETFTKTGDSGGMSYPGLGLRVHHAEGTVHFGDEVALLIVVSGATELGDGFSAVN